MHLNLREVRSPEFGIITENVIDYRVYYAAVDAAIDDQTRVAFDMGEWKDGTLVTPVVLVEEIDLIEE